MARSDIEALSTIPDGAPWGDAGRGAFGTLLDAYDRTGTGVVQLDSFEGSDDAKLTAALSYAAAQTRVPWIQFPARNVVLNQGGRIPFTGMKLMGPGGGSGTKNLEIQNGKPVNHRVTLNMGIGTNALFHSTEQIYNCNMSNMAFQSNHTAQVWDQPAGTLYAATFHSLTGYGLRHFFGRPGAKALMTQVSFTGHWQSLVHRYCQFTIGGSDNMFWDGGYCNLHGGTTAPGPQDPYQVEFQGLSKTNVGMIYLTAEGGHRGVRITQASRAVNFRGTVFEGRNAGNPAPGNLVRVEDGAAATFRDCWFAYAMADPGSDTGVVEVTGGDVLIDRPYYRRANGVAESVPFIRHTGGTLTVRDVAAIDTWSGKPRVQSTGGTLRADDTVVSP